MTSQTAPERPHGTDRPSLGRLAIVGNMNNSGFAMLRYFRDLGEDAHLLLYANDGTGTLSHFVPEADSWNAEPWKPYIHQTGVFNWTQSLVVNPRERTLPLSKEFIRRELTGYDTYIGSGAAPAIFRRVGMHLDAFFPYSTGVEFLGSAEILNPIRRVWINRWSLRRVQRLQREGIGATGIVFNAELGPTAETLATIDVPVEPYGIPAVYIGEEPSEEFVEKRSLELTAGRTAEFRIFCSSRVMFINKNKMPPEMWPQENKNTQYMFHALRILIDRSSNKDIKLFLPEYGPDVAEGKELCRQLGIAENVIWLPQLPRRDLRCLLKWCHVAIGQFYEKERIIWGGTGWEALAAGAPFIQRVNFSPEEYQALFGHPLPPMIHATNAEEIAAALVKLRESPEYREQVAAGMGNWFRSYNGYVLARKWLDAVRAHKSQQHSREQSGHAAA